MIPLAGRIHDGFAKRWPWALPVVLLLCLTLPHLDQGDFRSDTGWYSAIGLQAWRTGQFWTLMGEPGQPYFNKPPLALWIHGLVLHVMGPSLIAARLPTIAAACGCVALTASIGARLGGRRAGMWSGVALAGSIEFFRRAREISLDMWQLAFMLAAAWLVVRAAGSRRRAAWAALAGVPIGLALLTKPLVGLAALVLLGAWVACRERWRALGWLVAAAPIAVLIAGPWHIGMAAIHGEAFIAQYFGAQVADRAAGAVMEAQASSTPWWFYLEQIASGGWPWILFAGLGAAAWAKGRTGRGRMVAFAAIWGAGWLVVLSVFPDRRDRYSLPYHPAIAMMAGLWLGRDSLAPLARARRTLERWGAVAAIPTAILLAILPVRVQRPPDSQWVEFLAWHDQSGSPVLYQGAFTGPKGARLYLHSGRWPVTTRDVRGHRLDGVEPPVGALLVYHRRDGLAPGPGEVVVASFGDITITRLDEEPWRPVDFPDPGE